MLTWLSAYAIAGIVFGVLDGLWLGRIGRPLYQERMGPMIAERPRRVAAVIFYLVYLVGLTHFVTYPAITDGAWGSALWVGALFGFVCYSVWNFTNLATLRDFPRSIVPIDLTWGTALTTVTAISTYGICAALPWVAQAG